jgi:hypothetical protein
MQALWDHGGFHPYYKRRPESSDRGGRTGVPVKNSWEVNAWNCVGEAGAALETSVRKRCQVCENSAREAAGGKQNHHKREAVWAANSKAIGQSCPSPLSSHHASVCLRCRTWTSVSSVCPAGFQSCLGLILPCYFSSFPFWDGTAYTMPFYVGNM